MSASEYEPAATAETSEAERRARQIAQLVEQERLRRRRTLGLYLSLLAVPVALALVVLLGMMGLGPQSENTNVPPRDIEPIVRREVSQQLPPAVEARFGDEIGNIVEAKVGEKVQGASPAAVREIGEDVERVRLELTQVRAGVEGMQELKAALPQIRTQLDAQGANVREIQQRITRPPNGDGGNPALAAEFRQLQGRLGELEQKLDRSVTSLSAKMDENSKQLRSLSVKLSTIEKLNLPNTKRANE